MSVLAPERPAPLPGDVAGAPRPPVLELELPEGRVPLGYVRRGSSVFLVAKDRAARWPLTILRRGHAELSSPEGPVSGRVRLVAEPERKEEVLSLFRQAYGEARFERWYAQPARVLEVVQDLEGPGGPPPSTEDGAYEAWLRAEFDNVADDYDRHIFGNRMNRLLRERSLGQLRRAFPPGSRLLEVGCGSGVETLELLRAGHRIHAIDLSSRMLAVLEEKARARGVRERLTTELRRAAELPRKALEEPEGAFDGAYSTYGALNCEPDLRPLPAAFHRLIAPGGRLVLALYNRWCLFEILGYSLTGQGRRAFSRRRRPVEVGSSRFCVDVFAYSPGEVLALFEPYFRLERMEAVPVLLPPSDLDRYAEMFARRFDRLAAWDAWVGARWPWHSLGDHVLMSFRRA